MLGNAIGYIRLVRSGCLQCVSSAIQFLPELQSVSSFKELCCSPDFVDSRTSEAAENLDEYISSLASHFEKETDYFKVFLKILLGSRSCCFKLMNVITQSLLNIGKAVICNFLFFFLYFFVKKFKKEYIFF